jgi:hypothetical protein
MADANLYAAWIGILVGSLAGAVQGLFFHRDDWLGGYGSWPRRMMRLGHISFFGLGFINLAFALTVRDLPAEGNLVWTSRLFILGAFTMPLLCYLSSYKDFFRHLFFIPVLSVIVGTAILLEALLT